MKASLIRKFVECVGKGNALTTNDDLTRYTHENRGLFIGKTPLVLKPKTTVEVTNIVKLAAATSTPIVPQGGHTGHVGGAVPDESGNQIVISMERMNSILEVDTVTNILICQSGVVLETIQQTADDNDRLFPLALGSQGSCQIGGNIATNAGGTGVLAYGNTRDLVAGLEVVLPTGDVWDGMRRLKKDNTGFDLKNLIAGSEGTLGIITKCVLKLFPKPRGQAVALCGLKSPQAALELLGIAQERAAGMLTTFELMASFPMESTFRHMNDVRDPLASKHAWYVLAEVSSSRSEEDAATVLQDILETALADGTIDDAAVASSLGQRKDFWRIRELMPLAQKHEGGSMKNDVSVPVHRVPEFLERADAVIAEAMPDARVCPFGHLGDGNMHYNISQPVGADAGEFLARQPAINALIYELVVEMEGSVAAEHGVGRLKRDLIARTKDRTELALMRAIKEALDPKGIMNPGKVV